MVWYRGPPIRPPYVEPTSRDARRSSLSPLSIDRDLYRAQSGRNSVYKTLQSLRLYEQIVQQIEESVLKGALKLGDQLPPERELAQKFGVSRTAVPEAIKVLREKGLVEAYSG